MRQAAYFAGLFPLQLLIMAMAAELAILAYVISADAQHKHGKRQQDSPRDGDENPPAKG